MKHAGGRPSTYTPEVLDIYEEYINEAIPQNMKIPTVEGLALKIGTSITSMRRWAKVHPEFRSALRKLKMKQKEILSEIGIFGGKDINSNIVQLLLRVNHSMVETTKSDITSGGKPMPILGLDVRQNNSNREAPESE